MAEGFRTEVEELQEELERIRRKRAGAGEPSGEREQAEEPGPGFAPAARITQGPLPRESGG